MFNKLGRLDIFENFQTDFELPKFRKSLDDEEYFADDSPPVRNNIRFSSKSFGVTLNSGSTFIQNVESRTLTIHSWWRRALSWLFRSRKLEKPEKSLITVEQFFTHVKNDSLTLEVVRERAKGYELSINNAHRTGQKALYERLTKALDANRCEAQLVEMGLTSYLIEDRLVEFVKKAPKGLQLDWIKNFTRVIPDQVISRKVESDERLIFDNYVVLHYDPEKKSWAETEAEKEARRDPILFGVLQGSRKLYFVGDWVDDYCDLTLDQVADLLGADAISRVQ